MILKLINILNNIIQLIIGAITTCKENLSVHTELDINTESDK